MTAPLLEVKNLRMHFPVTEGVMMRRAVGEVKAVDGVDFTVNRGETLGLVGESGCGKTTTGRCILRLERPTGGEIRYDGVDIAQLDRKELYALRRRIQVIFQDPYSSLNPRMKVGDIQQGMKGAFLVVALKQAGGRVLRDHFKEHHMAPGDAMIVLGRSSDLAKTDKKQMGRTELL